MMTTGLEPANPEDHGLNVARLTTSLRHPSLNGRWAFHFTPVSMATVFEPGLISRALLVGISSIPSSFEDWSLYGRVYALLCGLFRMRGALFEHNPSVLPFGCGFSSVLYGRSKWPILCLCGLLLLFVTRVSATSNALSFVRGEERWCVSCSSPQRYPLLFDTSLSSPSFTSVLFRQVLFGELLITSFLVALFFSFHLPSVVSTHSSFWITGEGVEKAERERLPFRLLFVGDSREVKC